MRPSRGVALSSWATVFLLVCLGTLAAAEAPNRHRWSNFDKRSGSANNSVSESQREGARQLRARLPDGHVDFEPVTGAPKLISAGSGFLTGPGGSGKGVSGTVAASFAGQAH